MLLEQNFKVVDSGNGRAVVECIVEEQLTNSQGTLHGGVTATLVDDAGTLAIASADREGRHGVTTDLNVSYFVGAPKGSTVRAEGRVLRIGRTLAFVEVDIRSSEGKLLAQGRMTKYMPPR